eukprot:SAG11_NODE_6070_length_1394_cov_2.751351_2_plen_90_part_00
MCCTFTAELRLRVQYQSKQNEGEVVAVGPGARDKVCLQGLVLARDKGLARRCVPNAPPNRTTSGAVLATDHDVYRSAPSAPSSSLVPPP